MGLFGDEKTVGPAQGASAPMEKGATAVQNSDVAASPSAKATVPLYGGLKGGRKREDGLVPGSPEAAEADRKKEAQRKRDERAAAALASQPARLPAKVGIVQNQLPATGDSAASGAGVQVVQIVPWTAEIVKPFTSELIPVAELVDVNGIIEKAKAANLPAALVKEIEKGAQWPAVAKKNLDIALPRLSAKWLNRTGLSAEYADEVAVGSAFLMIVTSRNALAARIDKFAEQMREQERQNQKARNAGAGAASGNPS